MKTNLQTIKQGTRELRQHIVNDPSHWRMAMPTRVAPGEREEKAEREWRPGSRPARGYERAVSEWWWI